MGRLLRGWGGGGGQRVCWPPSQIIGGPGLPPSLPTPMLCNAAKLKMLKDNVNFTVMLNFKTFPILFR